MPRRKLRDNACLRGFRTMDMYGHQLGFNIDGEDVYKTSTGAFCSTLIFVLVIICAQYLVRDLWFERLDKPLTTILYPNYYENEPFRQQLGWEFAVGVSTFKNFNQGQNYSDFIEIGKFSLQYQIEGGPDDGFVFPIDMVPCTDEDWANFYEPYPSHAASIAAHKAAGQFYCPDAFDLSVINTFDHPESKIVILSLTACNRAEVLTCVGESDR